MMTALEPQQTFRIEQNRDHLRRWIALSMRSEWGTPSSLKQSQSRT